MARVLPLATIVTAIGVGYWAGVGSGLLVVAAGGLIGAVGLFWSKPADIERRRATRARVRSAGAPRGNDVDALEEEKRRLLRALKDLEGEHEIGKIDDADYEEIVARYRAEAKLVMRKMDGEVAPFREEAERIAREYLEKQGYDGAAAPVSAAPPVQAPPAERVACVRMRRVERARRGLLQEVRRVDEEGSARCARVIA